MYEQYEHEDYEHPDMCGCMACQEATERAHVRFWREEQAALKRELELNPGCKHCGHRWLFCECPPEEE